MIKNSCKEMAMEGKVAGERKRVRKGRSDEVKGVSGRGLFSPC